MLSISFAAASPLAQSEEEMSPASLCHRDSTLHSGGGGTAVNGRASSALLRYFTDRCMLTLAGNCSTAVCE